jgi:hypothetical protein
MVDRNDAAARGQTPRPGTLPFFDQVQSSELRELYFYWVATRGNRVMPLKHDIDPGHFSDLLPFVALITVESFPQRFRFAFVGSCISSAYKTELAGRYVDQLKLGDLGRADLEMMDETATSMAPTFRQNAYRRFDGAEMQQESVAMPLGSEMTGVDMILLGQKWEVLAKLPPN